MYTRGGGTRRRRSSAVVTPRGVVVTKAEMRHGSSAAEFLGKPFAATAVIATHCVGGGQLLRIIAAMAAPLLHARTPACALVYRFLTLCVRRAPGRNYYPTRGAKAWSALVSDKCTGYLFAVTLRPGHPPMPRASPVPVPAPCGRARSHTAHSPRYLRVHRF